MRSGGWDLQHLEIEALRSNRTLSHLFLCGNVICDSGTASHGEGLKSNCSLTQLYLAENRIGDPGAEALGKAMVNIKSLPLREVKIYVALMLSDKLDFKSFSNLMHALSSLFLFLIFFFPVSVPLKLRFI